MERIKALFAKKNRALLAELVRTDFKLRYQGSVLGYAWSLLRPLLFFVVLYVIFGVFLKIGDSIPHYPIYLLSGVVLWNFFNEMTSMSVGSIVARGDLIRKIRIPRWMIIFSNSISALINLGFSIIVVAVFMAIKGVSLLDTTPLVILVIIEMYILALGLSLFLSALFVKYRDVSYIWEVFINVGFYAAPIFYPLARIHNELFQKLIMINPISQIIQDMRWSVITHESTTIYQVFNGGFYEYIPFAIVILVLFVGVTYFKKRAKSFAEDI